MRRSSRSTEQLQRAFLFLEDPTCQCIVWTANFFPVGTIQCLIYPVEALQGNYTCAAGLPHRLQLTHQLAYCVLAPSKMSEIIYIKSSLLHEWFIIGNIQRCNNINIIPGSLYLPIKSRHTSSLFQHLTVRSLMHSFMPSP